MLSWRNVVHGGLVYAGGDSLAAALTGDFLLSRALGMLLVGGILYAVEIPAYFGWLERHFKPAGAGNRLQRAFFAQAFFNPLWIARHLAFIRLFSGRGTEIGWELVTMGLNSFLYAFPVALAVNYGIQNGLPLHWRFVASAIFSSCMAVYYALSEVLFG